MAVSFSLDPSPFSNDGSTTDHATSTIRYHKSTVTSRALSHLSLSFIVPYGMVLYIRTYVRMYTLILQQIYSQPPQASAMLERKSSPGQIMWERHEHDEI